MRLKITAFLTLFPLFFSSCKSRTFNSQAKSDSQLQMEFLKGLPEEFLAEFRKCENAKSKRFRSSTPDEQLTSESVRVDKLELAVKKRAELDGLAESHKELIPFWSPFARVTSRQKTPQGGHILVMEPQPTSEALFSEEIDSCLDNHPAHIVSQVDNFGFFGVNTPLANALGFKYLNEAVPFEKLLSAKLILPARSFEGFLKKISLPDREQINSVIRNLNSRLPESEKIVYTFVSDKAVPLSTFTKSYIENHLAKRILFAEMGVFFQHDVGGHIIPAFLPSEMLKDAEDLYRVGYKFAEQVSLQNLPVGKAVLKMLARAVDGQGDFRTAGRNLLGYLFSLVKDANDSKKSYFGLMKLGASSESLQMGEQFNDISQPVIISITYGQKTYGDYVKIICNYTQRHFLYDSVQHSDALQSLCIDNTKPHGLSQLALSAISFMGKAPQSPTLNHPFAPGTEDTKIQSYYSSLILKRLVKFNEVLAQ